MISDEVLSQITQEYEQALLASLPGEIPAHTFKEKEHGRKTKRWFAYSAFKRVACAVIVVALLGSAAIISSAEGHATVIGWINMVSAYFSPSRTTDAANTGYDLAQVPQGYRLVERSQRKGGGFVLYTDFVGNFLVLDYQYDPNGGTYFMKMENHIHMQETVDGQVMDIYISQDPAHRNAVVWSVPGEAAFSLSAYLEKNDLIDLAKQVIEAE